ncbi:MAG: hypothetical protein JW834_04275 [Candidatus Diapherotrites archaeon]|nr:hypothetical protein [Candidatus Diapherotrites archaeon]
MKEAQEMNKKLMEEMEWDYSSEKVAWVIAHLAEEVGEVATIIKKMHNPYYSGRTEKTEEELRDHLADELSDVIGLCVRIGVAHDIDLNAAMKRNHEKIRSKFERNGEGAV